MKMRHTICMLLVLFHLFGAQDSSAQQRADERTISRINLEWLYAESDVLYQDLYFLSSDDCRLSFHLTLYRMQEAGDSLKVLSLSSTEGFTAEKGINKLKIPLKDRRVRFQAKDDWLQAYKAMNTPPVGNYRCFIEIEDRNSRQKTAQTLLLTSDTLITRYDKLEPGIGKILGDSKTTTISKVLDRKQIALDRFYRKKGITSNRKQENGKEQLDLYYGTWYLGRKEYPASMTPFELSQSRETLTRGLDAIKGSALDNCRSLQSQFRDMQEACKDNTELSGDIALSANFGNGQEPNAALPNNYQEARADLSLPLFDIPIQVSGFYTTQDKYREAKASYIHFSYDAEKAKQQLLQLISGFNNKYTQAIGQGKSYDLIYGQFVDQLQQQKSQLISSLSQQYGLDPNDLSGLDADRIKARLKEKAEEAGNKSLDSLQGMADTSALTQAALDKKAEALALKQQAEEQYRKGMDQYQKLQELEAKIRKYQSLLEQYRKTSFYDSAMAFAKMKGLEDYEQMSYKDMAKKASSLLPESKTKSMITGLVNFDIGMFPKYVSDYTMSGQMMKGLDMSYDIGIATLGGSYGKMEYIDRSGNVEAYKSYSGRIQFKPLFQQQIGLVYYGYSPSKKLLQADGFFKDASLSLPSFRNPVSILSMTYNGQLGKAVELSGEYAYSDKPAQSDEAKQQIRFLEQSAYNIKAGILIPATNIEIATGYEHAGKSFENNTLPMLLAGTDRMFVKTKGDFFRSFLTLGAEYNYLIQQSFSGKGSNSKWGFDIATHSKRYPSVGLSYKPFSTFRSFNDTLNIAQKPISGEVWTGKANYQIKRLDKAIRFTLVYNSNSSTNDTLRYKSSTLQLSTILSRKTTTLMVNLGHSNIDAGNYETAYPMYNNSWFITNSLSGTIAESVQLSGGTDLTKAGPGISKYGCFLSGGYTLRKLPLTLNASFRYNNFRMAEQAARQQLVSGGIMLTWRIKEKIYTD